MPTPLSASAPRTDALPAIKPPRVGLVLTSLMLAAFVCILNETVLSVALPQLMDDFAVTADVAQWLTTGFLLTMAIVIPTTGFLSARFSRRTLFVSAMIAFLLGTVLAVLAGSFAAMLVARVVQALGTAVIMPLLMSTTVALVAPERRGLMMGMNAVVISVGPAIGPTLAGLVMYALDWHWVFLLMLPVAAIVLVLGAVAIRTPHERRAVTLDLPSVALAAVGFGGLVYALSSASSILRGDVIAIGVGVVGIAALVLFARRQARRAPSGQALLDLRPFGVPQFRRAVALATIAFGVMLGTVVILPIYFQDGVGLSVLETGVLLLGGGLTQAIAAPIFGRVFDRVGPRPLVIPGALVMIAAAVALATVTAETPAAVVVTLYVVLSSGIAAVLSSMMTSSMAALEPHLFGHGSAIVNTAQQLGGAIGTAGMVAALTIGGAGAATAEDSVIAGSHWAFIIAAAAAAIGAIVALRVRRTASSEARQGSEV